MLDDNDIYIGSSNYGSIDHLSKRLAIAYEKIEELDYRILELEKVVNKK